MKSFKEFITEAKQVGTLYHYTSPAGAGNILKSNNLKGDDLKNPDIVSFTRNKNFHKQKRLDVHTKISFEVDGDKLSNKYKINPYNDAGFGLGAINRSKKTSEAEERVERNIPMVKKYIKKIRIHSKISDKHLDSLKRHNIPIEYT